jgi:hypothetical protein
MEQATMGQMFQAMATMALVPMGVPVSTRSVSVTGAKGILGELA